MEHRLIQGGERFLPFARSRIKALRALGIPYASQSFEVDGASIKVSIVPGHEYIQIEENPIPWLVFIGYRTNSDTASYPDTVFNSGFVFKLGNRITDRLKMRTVGDYRFVGFDIPTKKFKKAHTEKVIAYQEPLHFNENNNENPGPKRISRTVKFSTVVAVYGGAPILLEYENVDFRPDGTTMQVTETTRTNFKYKDSRKDFRTEVRQFNRQDFVFAAPNHNSNYEWVPAPRPIGWISTGARASLTNETTTGERINDSVRVTSGGYWAAVINTAKSTTITPNYEIGPNGPTGGVSYTTVGGGAVTLSTTKHGLPKLKGTDPSDIEDVADFIPNILPDNVNFENNFIATVPIGQDVERFKIETTEGIYPRLNGKIVGACCKHVYWLNPGDAGPGMPIEAKPYKADSQRGWAAHPQVEFQRAVARFGRFNIREIFFDDYYCLAIFTFVPGKAHYVLEIYQLDLSDTSKETWRTYAKLTSSRASINPAFADEYEEIPFPDSMDGFIYIGMLRDEAATM